MINWHLEPRSKRLIAKLQGRVTRVTRVAIPCDYTDYVGIDPAARRTLEALQARRTRAIERHLGCTFAAACADNSRHAEIMAALEAAPEVAAVVGGAA